MVKDSPIPGASASPDTSACRFWNHKFYQASEFEWQATLFQPVGGMDQIVEGFKRRWAT